MNTEINWLAFDVMKIIYFYLNCHIVEVSGILRPNSSPNFFFLKKKPMLSLIENIPGVPIVAQWVKDPTLSLW